MIKSTTHVILLVVLSFGVMATGVNPSLRTDIQATIRSTSAALSALFIGNVNFQEGSVYGVGRVNATTGILTNSSPIFNGLHTSGNVQSSIVASDPQAKINAATNSRVNTGLTVNNSAASRKVSTSVNAQVGANAESFLPVNTLFHGQLQTSVGVSK